MLPNCIAICTKHHPEPVADIDIFYGNLDFHVEALSMAEEDLLPEKSCVDTGILVEMFPHSWAVIMEKGYQGTAAAEYFRVMNNALFIGSNFAFI